MIYIYTDCSLSKINNYYTKAAVIVKDHHIIEILYKYYKKKLIQYDSNYYERVTYKWAIKKVLRKYSDDIMVFCDNKQAVKKGYREYKIKWVSSSRNFKRCKLKHKFMKLADYISKHGLDEKWKEWWHDKL